MPRTHCFATGASPRAKKVGIVGLGGLGHMGVKFAHALGAQTVVMTISPDKKEDALRLGADEVILNDGSDRKGEAGRQLRLIQDCVAAEYYLNAYIQLLAVDGDLTMVRAPDTPLSIGVFGLIFGRKIE